MKSAVRFDSAEQGWALFLGLKPVSISPDAQKEQRETLLHEPAT